MEIMERWRKWALDPLNEPFPLRRVSWRAIEVTTERLEEQLREEAPYWQGAVADKFQKAADALNERHNGHGWRRVEDAFQEGLPLVGQAGAEAAGSRSGNVGLLGRCATELRQSLIFETSSRSTMHSKHIVEAAVLAQIHRNVGKSPLETGVCDQPVEELWRRFNRPAVSLDDLLYD